MGAKLPWAGGWERKTVLERYCTRNLPPRLPAKVGKLALMALPELIGLEADLVSAAQAPGADNDPLRLPVKRHRGHLGIGPPLTAGVPLGMAHLTPKGNPFAADLTFPRQCYPL